MSLLCFQSFGTNAMSAKEEKRFGISENVLYNICIVLSGHDGELILPILLQAAAKLSKTAGQKCVSHPAVVILPAHTHKTHSARSR